MNSEYSSGDDLVYWTKVDGGDCVIALNEIEIQPFISRYDVSISKAQRSYCDGVLTLYGDSRDPLEARFSHEMAETLVERIDLGEFDIAFERASFIRFTSG